MPPPPTSLPRRDPPTADDIGRRICAQCEDNFDPPQGYSKYSEAGPVEADPLLVSMAESALSNGRYECKDAALSVGTQQKEHRWAGGLSPSLCSLYALSVLLG
jgi:hypothetical protein